MNINLPGNGKGPSLSGTALKWIALAAMTIDHIGLILFPKVALLRIIGRLAYPIFAYFIAEGCRYTRHKLRYFLTLFLSGAACDIAYAAIAKCYFNCIFTTFALSVFLIFAVESAQKNMKSGDNVKSVLSLAWCVAAAAIAVICGCFEDIFGKYYINIDYGLWGILIPVAVWAVKDRKIKLAVLGVGLIFLTLEYGGYQIYAFLALVPLMFYNGARGKRPMKYFFYVYYPAHIAALYIIAALVGK